MNGEPGRIYFVFCEKIKRNKNHAKIIIFPPLKTKQKTILPVGWYLWDRWMLGREWRMPQSTSQLCPTCSVHCSRCLLSNKNISLSPLLFTPSVVSAPADTAAWWRDPTLCPELRESDTLVPAADMWAMFDNVPSRHLPDPFSCWRCLLLGLSYLQCGDLISDTNPQCNYYENLYHISNWHTVYWHVGKY